VLQDTFHKKQTHRKNQPSRKKLLQLLRVAHLSSVRRNKAINLSFPPDLWEWLQKKSEINGLKIPVSRVVAHLLKQVIEKEKRERSH